ncbi:MAG: hypothetical protein J07HN4v3_00089 [Halonotius sp. J07HN4]|nr:MAG: hypothetical protein J07HN4v3_00089 [Halonotius sp. J07HN4]
MAYDNIITTLLGGIRSSPFVVEPGKYGELIRYHRHHNEENLRYGAAGVLAESVDRFAEQVTPYTRKALAESKTLSVHRTS